MKCFRLFFLITTLTLGLSASASAHTTNLTLEVYLQSGGDDINAFGGTLHYPTAWTVANLRLHDSPSVYWITAPKNDTVGTFSYSGIIPGGIQHFESSTSQELLFSIDFVGDEESVGMDKLYFDETEFYLNHPAALMSTAASFHTEWHSTDSFASIEEENPLIDLLFSFQEDPLTGAPSLVLNSSSGRLAAYSFEEKEGDFNLGEWFSVEGVRPLQSSNSTVTLSAQSVSGDYYSMVLRRSSIRHTVLFIALLVFIGFVVKVFLKTLELLRSAPSKR